MGRFFAPEIGVLEIIPFYADNEMYCQELCFSVPAGEWCKFENSQLYRDLVKYVHSLKTQDKYKG